MEEFRDPQFLKQVIRKCHYDLFGQSHAEIYASAREAAKQAILRACEEIPAAANKEVLCLAVARLAIAWGNLYAVKQIDSSGEETIDPLGSLRVAFQLTDVILQVAQYQLPLDDKAQAWANFKTLVQSRHRSDVADLIHRYWR